MSEAKFTKGPWGRTTFANGQPRVYRIGRDYKEADIAHTHGSDDVANAHLIAAAPEMYELLTDLRHTISLAGIIGADNTAVLKSIDNLLAKARGVLNE